MSQVLIPAAGVRLAADLTMPSQATGVVLFAHGSGSSRLSPRNRAVAETLNRRGQATVLVDLLTDEEERIDVDTAELRFDIDLLAQRLVSIVDWLREGPTGALPTGLFGASTGAAAALVTAAARPDGVHAVVSRGGRPDLAGAALPMVLTPTLLLVGALDEQVLELNERAAEALGGPVELRIVPGATHLFEEPGALDRVAGAAADWFEAYLTPVGGLGTGL
jgi:dienelactone hydrolase